MTRNLRELNTNRRKFLRDVAAASGLAVVAATTSSTSGAAPVVEAQPKTGKRSGYRVTAHVAKYYDKARN